MKNLVIKRFKSALHAFLFLYKIMAVGHGCTFSKMMNQKCPQKQNPKQQSRGLRFIDLITSNMVATMSILNNPRCIQLINTLKWQPELIERGRLMFINLRPHILPAAGLNENHASFTSSNIFQC